MKITKDLVVGTTRRGRAVRLSLLLACLLALGIGITMTVSYEGQGYVSHAMASALDNPDAEVSDGDSVDELTEEAPKTEDEQISDDPLDEEGSQEQGAPEVASLQEKTGSDQKEASSTQTSSATNPANSKTEPSIPSTPTHTHSWTNVTKTVHHDAEYKQVWHDPIYETRTTYHDVCNQCGAILDGGLAATHLKSTSCSSYSTGVPSNENVLVSKGYYESVLVKAAWDETVVTGKRCSCGATA